MRQYPQAGQWASTLADLPDEPVLPRSTVAVDDDDFRPAELVRGVLRGGLELMEPLDS